MHNRRTFLRNTGGLALGSAMLAKNPFDFLLKNKKPHAVGLQLFTLFSVFDKDVPGSLAKIAGIGYKELESAFSMKGGFYGMSAKEFAAACKTAGLSWVSHHALGAPIKPPPGGFKIPGADTTKKFDLSTIKNLRDNPQEIVDQAAEGGVKYLVAATIPHHTLDEIKSSVDVMSKAGELCKKAGIQFCYHNHTTEFEAVEGQVPYEIFLSQTDPNLVKMELDLGWATKAGADPVELFKKHPGRFPLWHVKDLSKSNQMPDEIGAGTVDFKRIFENASTSGMQHFFVEQDGAPKPFENIAHSFQAITKLMA